MNKWLVTATTSRSGGIELALPLELTMNMRGLTSQKSAQSY